MTARELVATTIRPDTVVFPNTGGRAERNRLPIERSTPGADPEFKVSAGRGRKADGAPRGRTGRQGAPDGHACAAAYAVFTLTGEYGFYVTPPRHGCQACFNACAECDTHRGVSMIHVDFLDRRNSIATVPTVCMHCDDPTCAEVCPADAIKKNEDGVVQSALKPRCIACSNCVLACPFGVPKMMRELEQMMKCDMCYDRTSVGKRPMCATVCPSQALAYVSPATIARSRREVPTNVFRFGPGRDDSGLIWPRRDRSGRRRRADYMWEAP